MNATQVQLCIEELTNSFSSWTPEQSELRKWSYVMSLYSYEAVKKALDKLYWEKGQERAPKPKAFKTILDAMRTGDNHGATLPEPNAHLICSGLDDKGLGCVGRVETLGWTSPLVPLHSNPRALEIIEDLKGIYGGRWICFYGSGSEAIRKSWELKKEARDG